ncbi:MAG TPA: response regulator transcription factor [Dehalococcoidia bacterium]|nr:response regulator transcription factor [Dehalococcoidia bacterium]
MTTRLMIVDDHEVVRMGLRAALEVEPDFIVVAEAGNGQDAIDKARAHQPDIVLMDVRMDGMDGIEACREIRNELPATKVLMLTSFAEEETVVAALLAGAAGYVLKNVARSRLLEALRSVAAGESLLDSKVTRAVLDKLVAQRQSAPVDDGAELTAREREVLALIAEGATNKEIAASLVVSENTARNHVSHILSKLGFSRRSEAAAYAVKKGIVRE